MEENTSKVKTYLIILIFLMIIFISGYIVYSKIKTTNNKEEKKKIESADAKKEKETIKV